MAVAVMTSRVVRPLARRLTSANLVEHAPAWSPDGRSIAYVTWNDSTGGDVWRIAADGNEVGPIAGFHGAQFCPTS